MVYFRHEKERMERLRITTRYGLTEGVAEENKSMGQARVGGPYKLIDFDGKEVTQDTYAGKHTLVCSLKRDAKTDLFRVYSVSGYLS